MKSFFPAVVGSCERNSTSMDHGTPIINGLAAFRAHRGVPKHRCRGYALQSPGSSSTITSALNVPTIKPIPKTS
jgi:hypothetical protein